jgi:ATP-dependent Clp protease adapter protein ClpS
VGQQTPLTIDPRIDAVTEEDVGRKVHDLFGEDFAVIIMDSDFTTFDEVERACIALFGYSKAEAEILSMRVHTTGEALAAVMPEDTARRAVRQLRSRNVLARVEKV